MKHYNDVLIVGGGIAGLSLASGLAPHGVNVEVAEMRSGEVHGSGIGFWPYAIRAFGTLGLKDRILQSGFVSPRVNLCDAHGNILNTTINREAPGTDLPAEFLISRLSLARELTATARERGTDIRYLQTVENIDQDERSAEVTFADGRRKRYDVVVGADGAYSKIRQRYINAESGPKTIDSGTWRTLIKYDDVLPIGHAFQGAENMAYMYPTGDGYIYAGLSTRRAEARYDDLAGRARLRELLSEFTAPQVRYFREQLDEAIEVTYRLTASHIVPAPWHNGRIVLIGDAAHTMPANLSGGGSMAVEDAAVLTKLLLEDQPVEHTMKCFVDRRFARVQRVVTDSVLVRAGGTNIDVWGGKSKLYNDAFEWLMQPA